MSLLKKMVMCVLLATSILSAVVVVPVSSNNSYETYCITPFIIYDPEKEKED